MPLIPFVKNGFFGSRSWIPLVKGNGLTAGGDEPEPPVPVPTYTTVTGFSPLALLNAIQLGIRKLTQYGKCTQASTPTPDAPVDIMTNNGALKYGKPLTLDPTRYYAYIGSGNYWSYTTDSYSIVIPVTVGKKYRITADPTTPVDGNIQNVILRWGFVDTVYDNWKQTSVQPSILTVRIYDWVRSTPQDTQSVEVTATRPFMVIQMGAVAFASNLANGRIGVAVQEVYTDGTPEVLTVRGKNLFDKDNMPAPVYTAYISNASGEGKTRLVSGTSERTVLMPIEPNTTYTVTKVYTDRLRIAEFSTIPNISPATSGTLLASDTSDAQRTERTITTGATAAYLAIQINNARIESQSTTLDAVLASLQVEEGSTATAYEPYVQPQTVTDIPMLLGVGDYKDEAELIHGLTTHKVGIMVFDGTEAWRASTSANIYILDSAIAVNLTAICTHFQKVSNSSSSANMLDGTFKGHPSLSVLYFKDESAGDVDGFKARIAAQYAAGTPVIMLYALATPTTEQTTPHNLHTTEGDNVVDAHTNVDPVTLEVEYANGYG